MQDTTRITLILLGLFLVSMALAFIVFSVFKEFRGTTSVINKSPVEETIVKPSPTPSPVPPPFSPQTLPKTGFPMPLVGIFATSFIISGYFLRKFPN